MPGSSPLTRGKPLGAHRRIGTEGLIPAHAGKTSCSTTSARTFRAHPRSRGENGVRIWIATARTGSSPLTRGKLPVERRGFPRGGLIPAHAGKTSGRASRVSTRRAHPRSRGENPMNRCSAPQRLGSSPLTRGKPLRGLPGAGPQGLIPAHAGKTKACAHSFQLTGAHPRSRGENNVAWIGVASPGGSSPLTRGKPRRKPVRVATYGLIPAHAGKTSRTSVSPAAPRAHPRSRGENTWGRCPRSACSGSSPLTRGKRRSFHAWLLI